MMKIDFTTKKPKVEDLIKMIQRLDQDMENLKDEIWPIQNPPRFKQGDKVTIRKLTNEV